MENHVGGFVMVMCGREDVRLCLPIQQELDTCAASDHRLQSIENILFFLYVVALRSFSDWSVPPS